MEEYARYFESKRMEGVEGRNVEQMQEQIKRAIVDIAREVYSSARVEKKNPKNVQWNDVVKAAAERKKAVWKEVLGVRDEAAKEKYMEV